MCDLMTLYPYSFNLEHYIQIKINTFNYVIGGYLNQLNTNIIKYLVILFFKNMIFIENLYYY